MKLPRLLEKYKDVSLERLILFQWWRNNRPGPIPPDARVFEEMGTHGPLYAWLFEPEGPRTGPDIVFFHGNYTIIDREMAFVEGYRRRGHRVIFPEYRGFRHLPGWPSRSGLRDDLIELLERLRVAFDFDPRKSVFHGHSLGGLIVGDAAAHFCPQGLILEATVSSQVDFASMLKIPRFLMKENYDVIADALKSKCPVQILHFTNDRTVPAFYGKKIQQGIPGSRLREWPLDHNVIRRTDFATEYWDEISNFISKLPVRC